MTIAQKNVFRKFFYPNSYRNVELAIDEIFIHSIISLIEDKESKKGLLLEVN